MNDTDLQLARIPQAFFDDHCERDLPAPVIVKRTKSHYYISLSDGNLEELLDDADYYSSKETLRAMGSDPIYKGLCYSARATIAAVSAARQEVEK